MPGLRGLCDPQGRAAHAAAARLRSGEHRVHLGHRLLQPLPLLYRELRLPHDPRPRACGCDGREACQPGPRRVAGDRRRRWPLHRRQPHDARASPQREHADHAVQQRDLRPDQGPVLAHQPRRHALADKPDRIGRSPRQPLRLCAGQRRALRRARDRRVEEPSRRAQGSARPPGRGLRRDFPELHCLQQGRVRRLRRAEGCGRPAAVAGRRRADAVRQG